MKSQFIVKVRKDNGRETEILLYANNEEHAVERAFEHNNNPYRGFDVVNVISVEEVRE